MRVYIFFMMECGLDVEFQSSVLEQAQADDDLVPVVAESFAGIVFRERHGNPDRDALDDLPQVFGESCVWGMSFDALSAPTPTWNVISVGEKLGIEEQRRQSAGDLAVEEQRVPGVGRALRSRGCRRCPLCRC